MHNRKCRKVMTLQDRWMSEEKIIQISSSFLPSPMWTCWWLNHSDVSGENASMAVTAGQHQQGDSERTRWSVTHARGPEAEMVLLDRLSQPSLGLHPLCSLHSLSRAPEPRTQRSSSAFLFAFCFFVVFFFFWSNVLFLSKYYHHIWMVLPQVGGFFLNNNNKQTRRNLASCRGSGAWE